MRKVLHEEISEENILERGRKIFKCLSFVDSRSKKKPGGYENVRGPRQGSS